MSQLTNNKFNIPAFKAGNGRTPARPQQDQQGVVTPVSGNKRLRNGELPPVVLGGGRNIDFGFQGESKVAEERPGVGNAWTPQAPQAAQDPIALRVSELKQNNSFMAELKDLSRTLKPVFLEVFAEKDVNETGEVLDHYHPQQGDTKMPILVRMINDLINGKESVFAQNGIKGATIVSKKDYMNLLVNVAIFNVDSNLDLAQISDDHKETLDTLKNQYLSNDLQPQPRLGSQQITGRGDASIGVSNGQEMVRYTGGQVERAQAGSVSLDAHRNGDKRISDVKLMILNSPVFRQTLNYLNESSHKSNTPVRGARYEVSPDVESAEEAQGGEMVLFERAPIRSHAVAKLLNDALKESLAFALASSQVVVNGNVELGLSDSDLRDKALDETYLTPVLEMLNQLLTKRSSGLIAKGVVRRPWCGDKPITDDMFNNQIMLTAVENTLNPSGNYKLISPERSAEIDQIVTQYNTLHYDDMDQVVGRLVGQAGSSVRSGLARTDVRLGLTGATLITAGYPLNAWARASGNDGAELVSALMVFGGVLSVGAAGVVTCKSNGCCNRDARIGNGDNG